MKLTTKGRYAVTAMLDLALHFDKGPVTLADISKRQGISLSYLEQLFARLRKNQLVKSVRGPGGGYLLSRDAESVDIAEIIDAVSETVDATRCGGRGDCQDGEQCLSHQLWCDLSDQIYDFLKGISLAQVMRKREVRNVAERQEMQFEQHTGNLISTLAVRSNA